MTLYDFLIDIRGKVIQSLETQDKALADELYITLDRLLNSAYEHDAQAQAIVLSELLDSARDAIGGTSFKAEVPSEEAIRAVFPPSAKEAS